MGPGGFLGLGALLFIVGGVLSFVTGLDLNASAALFVLGVIVLVLGAATRSALVWVGLVAVVFFGGMLLFAFLRSIPSV